MLRRLPIPAGLLILATLLLCGPASADRSSDYAKAYAAHDFFALRTLVAADRGPDSEQKRFYTAAVLTAFDQPAAANKLIEPMLAKNIDTALMPFLMQMRLENDLRLYDYAGALDAERTLIDLYERKGDARLAAAQNHLKLLSVLSGTDPQQVTRSGDSHIILAAQGGGNYCAPVTVGIDPCYSFAGDLPYSMITRSEAQRLKLKVTPAGFQLPYGGSNVSADVTVASSLLLGNLQYDNVVFLVVPDGAISVRGESLPGIFGYPVYAGMGSLTQARRHVLDIPKRVAATAVDNVALDGDLLLTQVQVRGHQALCRLNFRSPHTVFYKTYYDDYMDDLGGVRPKVAPTGTTAPVPPASLPIKELTLTVAGHDVTLRHSARIYLGKNLPQDYIMCDLGQDVFKKFKSYTLNLSAMSLTLD
ncbi:MAG TPA: retropepsin-like aspartic protease [Gammaproteobacteria bacterium]|nr:retropepsin-like aspartic protease [Gammaproteobacteria bacterium]